jgi:DNA-binding response OmpR family regulator
MANIAKGFWQATLPPQLPSIQLARDLSIHLDRYLVERGKKLIKLTPQEAMMLFILIEKRRVSPDGIVPTWYLVKQVLSKPGKKADAVHAIGQIASNIRGKLGDKKPHRFLVCVPGVGYKLCAEEGFGFITP